VIYAYHSRKDTSLCYRKMDLRGKLCEKDEKLLKKLTEEHHNGPVAQLIHKSEEEAKEAFYANKGRAAHTD
jgi:hypothetical protein